MQRPFAPLAFADIIAFDARQLGEYAFELPLAARQREHADAPVDQRTAERVAHVRRSVNAKTCHLLACLGRVDLVRAADASNAREQSLNLE